MPKMALVAGWESTGKAAESRQIYELQASPYVQIPKYVTKVLISQGFANRSINLC
jgi:hypothetical protein